MDGGRNHHARYGRSLISGETVKTLTGKMPILSVFPRVVAYAPKTNSRPVAQKRRVVTLTIDVFGHLQQVSLNNYIKLASEFLYLLLLLNSSSSYQSFSYLILGASTCYTATSASYTETEHEEEEEGKLNSKFFTSFSIYIKCSI